MYDRPARPLEVPLDVVALLGAAGPAASDDGTTVAPAAATRTAADFATLYHGEYDRLVRIAYLILGSRELAEEIVQDAFVRLHGRFAKVDSPPAYLRTSVVNGCHDVHRRLQRYRRREAALVQRDEVIDTPDELADALDRLTARQRAALVLRYYEGLQEAEIAQALGVKVGTVKSLLHRGIEQLRKDLT